MSSSDGAVTIALREKDERIAELEAELAVQKRMTGDYIDAEERAKQRAIEAEAALAERERMRCTSCTDEAECSILTAVCEWSDWEIEDGAQFCCVVHSDLRARAEAEPERVRR